MGAQYDILLQEGSLDIPHCIHVSCHLMAAPVEAPDVVVPLLFLQLRGQIAASPDATTGKSEVFVGNNLVGSAMEEQ